MITAKRNLKRWKRKNFWHKTIEKFGEQNILQTGIHGFSKGGLYYDLLIENKESDTTIFFFHANITREDKELPFFMGNRVFSNEHVNRVFISDPSLLMSHDLSLAWYSGVNNNIKVQDVLLETIHAIIKIFDSKKNIFFGPSNGGFAALYFSWFFPNSLAFVINPQTRISDFTDIAVKKYMKDCLNIENPKNIHKEIISVTGGDVREMYTKKMNNKIVYLQNTTDHHIQLQMLPFLQNIDPKSYELIMGNWGIGHKAPPLDFINYLLRWYIEYSDIWDR